MGRADLRIAMLHLEFFYSGGTRSSHWKRYESCESLDMKLLASRRTWIAETAFPTLQRLETSSPFYPDRTIGCL